MLVPPATGDYGRAGDAGAALHVRDGARSPRRARTSGYGNRALAALAPCGARFELAAHLPVLRDMFSVWSAGRVHVGPGRSEAAEAAESACWRAHGIPWPTPEPLELLDEALRKLGVLPLECRLRGLLHQAPDQREASSVPAMIGLR